MKSVNKPLFTGEFELINFIKTDSHFIDLILYDGINFIKAVCHTAHIDLLEQSKKLNVLYELTGCCQYAEQKYSFNIIEIKENF